MSDPGTSQTDASRPAHQIQQSSLARQRRPRLVGLDALRFLAVLLVLGRHMPPIPQEIGHLWGWILFPWRRGGWIGVDLFFVLSGFLVSGLLFQEYRLRGQFSTLRFYARRGWKIYPPFIVLIVVTTIARVFIDSAHNVPLPELAAEIFFLQSYWPGLWNHTWSLAVEEHFYLLLPLVLSLVLAGHKNDRGPLRPVLLVSAGTAVVAMAFRLFTWSNHPSFSPQTHLFPSHLRLDSLAAGVAISYLYHFHNRKFTDLLYPWRSALIVGGGALLTPAFLLQLETTPFIFTWGLSVFYVGSSMLLVGFLLSDLSRNRIARGMAALGSDSYSIYLWHMPVLVWLVPHAERIWGSPIGFGATTFVYGLGSLIVGTVMARLVERPALRLRDYWFPSKTQ